MNKKNLKESKIVFLYLTLALSPFLEGCGSNTEKNNVFGDQQMEEDSSFGNNENFDDNDISGHFENEETKNEEIENEDEPDDSYEEESNEILIEQNKKLEKEKQEISEKYQKEMQKKENEIQKKQNQIQEINEQNKKSSEEGKDKLKELEEKRENEKKQLKEEQEKMNYNIKNCSVAEQGYLSSRNLFDKDLFRPVHNAREMLGLSTPDNKQKIAKLSYEIIDKKTITVKEIKNILKGSFTENEIWTRKKIKEIKEKKEKYLFRFFCDNEDSYEYIEYKMGKYLDGYSEKLNFVVDYVCENQLWGAKTKRGMISISGFTRISGSQNNPTEINFKNLEIYLTKEDGEEVKLTIN